MIIPQRILFSTYPEQLTVCHEHRHYIIPRLTSGNSGVNSGLKRGSGLERISGYADARCPISCRAASLSPKPSPRHSGPTNRQPNRARQRQPWPVEEGELGGDGAGSE
ncbi:MAG TPA: hypothetical protein EYP49_16850 [Anaerolineae bacterium]|nr:hypothetical protein [Anaerolineae bacterium]